MYKNLWTYIEHPVEYIFPMKFRDHKSLNFFLSLSNSQIIKNERFNDKRRGHNIFERLNLNKTTNEKGLN